MVLSFSSARASHRAG